MTNQGEISEQDICTQYILPALVRSGWDVSKQVREQVYFTDGRIYVKGNQTRRGKAKKAESCDFTHISTSWMIKCYLSCVQDEIIRKLGLKPRPFRTALIVNLCYNTSQSCAEKYSIRQEVRRC
jgi:hypothetical protein